jgi:hypothetical protein
MSWTDSNALYITNVRGSTGWGSDGHWTWETVVKPVEEYSLSTPDAYNYQPINVDNVNDFVLNIRAHNDIHVGLFTDSSDMYEIVIGGWGN